MQQSLTKERQSVTMLLTAFLRWTRSSSAIIWTQLCTECLSRRIQPPIIARRCWERFAKRPSKEERSEVAKNAYTVSHRLAGFLNLNRNNCKDFHTSRLGSASKTSIPFIKSWHFKKGKGIKCSLDFWVRNLNQRRSIWNIYTVYAYCVHAIFSTKKPLHHNKVSFPTKTVLIEHETAAGKKVTRQKVVAFALHLGNFSKDCSLLRAADAFRVTWTEQVFRLGYVTEMHWPRRPGKTPYRN